MDSRLIRCRPCQGGPDTSGAPQRWRSDRRCARARRSRLRRVRGERRRDAAERRARRALGGRPCLCAAADRLGAPDDRLLHARARLGAPRSRDARTPPDSRSPTSRRTTPISPACWRGPDRWRSTAADVELLLPEAARSTRRGRVLRLAVTLERSRARHVPRRRRQRREPGARVGGRADRGQRGPAPERALAARPEPRRSRTRSRRR